jgi:hypothetical protein
MNTDLDALDWMCLGIAGFNIFIFLDTGSIFNLVAACVLAAFVLT